MTDTLEQVKPKPAYKPRHSIKDPSLKAAVIANRMNGKPKSHIAKDLNLAHNTVNVILAEADLDKQIEIGRIGIGGLIPKAINVVDYRLGKNSETAAFKVLEGIGVLRSKSDVNINIAAVSSGSWYQRRSEVKQIDVEASESNVSNSYELNKE